MAKGSPRPRPDLDEVLLSQHVDTFQQQAMFLCFMGVAVLLLRNSEVQVDDTRLLWVFAGFLLGNGAIYRLLERWPGPAALCSLGLNTLLVALSVDMSGGSASVLWPLFLLPIFTAGMVIPRWTVRAAGLQTALLLCFYLEPLRNDEPGAGPEVIIKAGFLLLSAWTIGKYGSRERDSRQNLALAHRRKEELEREVERAHKLEALGALAGEAAHDFRNVVHVILSHAQTALETLAEGKDVEPRIRAIEKAAEKGEKMITGLLEFGAKGAFEITPLDLREELERMRPSLEAVVGRAVRVEIEGEALPRVLADAHHLGNALLNLASNARDAMPGGGTFSLRAAGVVRGDEELVDPSVPAGEWVRLAVGDTGSGMTAEALAHVFEPFFTTKKGVGTGLGLPAVYGAVRRCGGHIEVESVPHSGTTFRIYLPLSN